MTHVTNQTADEHRTRQNSAEISSSSEYASSQETTSSVDGRALLAGFGLSRRGSSSVRASAMQAMQQTHGNRSVQRVVQRQATRPAAGVQVQRLGMEDVYGMVSGAPAIQEFLQSPWLAEPWSVGTEAPKSGEQPRGYANFKQNELGGYEGDVALDSGRGDIGGVPVGAEFGYGGGKFGAWKDGDNERHGFKLGGGAVRMDFNKDGGPVSGDVSGGSGGVEASVGDDGATLGASGNLVEGSITTAPPTADSNLDEQYRGGLSYGGGAAGRLHWGDKDKDGYREYGFGFDAGPVSLDIKTEDPLRSAIPTVLRPAAFDILGEDADRNLTEDVYNATADFGESIYETGNDIGEEAVNTYKDVKEGAGEMYNEASNYAEEKVEAAGDYVEEKKEAVEDYVEEKYEAVKEYIPNVTLDDLNPFS